MRPRQSFDSAIDCLHVVVDTSCARQPDNRLNDGKGVTRPVVDLARKQNLTRLCFLAIGDVDRDAADPHHAAASIDARRRRTGAPTQFAAWTSDAKLDLLRALAHRNALKVLAQRRRVLGMDERADVRRRYAKGLRVDAEDPVLALVPSPFVGRGIPVPRTHLTRRERETPPLFALQQPRGRSFKFGGAFGDMAFRQRVGLFELASLAVQLDEYLDFR